jgi:hypothetical protein
MRRVPTVAGLVLLAFTVPVSDVEARRTGNIRRQAIDMVIIHSTGGPTCDGITGKPIWVEAGTLEDNMRLIEAHPLLGIHYMIDRDGTLRTSVREEEMVPHVFTHSGRSIAIELINDGNGLDPFSDLQLKSLVKLLRDIKQRRDIKRDGIKRHSDIDLTRLPCDRSKRRKVDPGAAFPYASILDRVFLP